MVDSRRSKAEDGLTTVILRPSSGWSPLNARELWAFRELAYFLAWRDVKIRYKQSAFGVAWAVLQPLLLMGIFTLFLGRLEGIAPPGIPYPLFVFAGLVPWTLFSQSLVGASDSLVSSSNLIQKVYFPRLLLPLSAIGSKFLDFLIALLALLVLMIILGSPLTISILWLIPLTVLTIVSSLAVGVGLAAINVRYRDVKHAVPFLIQAWLFASPVVYSATVIPAEWQAIYALNPMVGVLGGFRWALFGYGTPPPVGSIVLSMVTSCVLLVISVSYFRRVERTFADVI